MPYYGYLRVFSGPALVQVASTSVGNPCDRLGAEARTGGRSILFLETSFLCTFHAINHEEKVDGQLQITDLLTTDIDLPREVKLWGDEGRGREANQEI